MIREFKVEDFYNKEIKTDKAKEYVAELQKAYDKLNSLVVNASKFVDSGEDTMCIFDYMDFKDSFLSLIVNLLRFNDSNYFDDSVYSDMTKDLLEEL